MQKKLIISFEEYLDTVEKLSIEINKAYNPTVLVGIMRGAAPIIDILSRILKLPTAYIVIQSYSGKGLEDQQGDLIFSREISSIADDKDFKKVLLVDDLSDTGLTLNRSIEWLKNYNPIKDHIVDIKTAKEIEHKLKSYLHHREFDLESLSLNQIEGTMREKKAIYDLKVDKTVNKIGAGSKLENFDKDKLPIYIQKNFELYKEWID